MAEETTTAQVDTASDVNQDAIVDDFAGEVNSDYLKQHEFVDNGEPQNTPTPEQGKSPEAPKVEVAKTVEPEKKLEGLDAKLFKLDENGNKVFDVNQASSFFSPADDPLAFKGLTAPQQANPQQAQPNAQQPVVPDNTPAWKKELTAEREYQKNLREGAMKPVMMLNQLLSQGTDMQTALQSVQAQMNADLEDHLRERAAQKEEERMQKQYERMEETTKQKEMESVARSNELLFANTLGQNEYMQLFFSPQIGGPAIQWAFMRDVPEAKTLSGQAFKDAQAKWWTKFASEKENLSFIYNYGKAQLALSNIPHIAKSSAAKREAEINKQELSKVRRPSGIVSTPRATPDANDPSRAVADWLGRDSLDDMS